MEHLVEITVFLASISAILLVSGLIIVKTNFPLSSKSAESDKKITFWFQRNELKQSTNAAHNMLRDLKLADGLTDLLTFFEHRFPGATSIAGGKDGINELGSSWKHDQAILRITKKHEDVQIELIDPTTASNIYTLRRAKHELEMVQNVVENTPFPVWQIAESGNVMMSNAAFRELGSDLGKQLIHFATSNNIHVERVKFEVEKKQTTALVRYQQIFITQKLGSICIGRHRNRTRTASTEKFCSNTYKNLCHAFHWSGDF